MASPDSIVPDPTNPQSFNRFSYVRNNPLRYTDPTGHRECESNDVCSPSTNPIWVAPFLDNMEWTQYYGYTAFGKDQYKNSGDQHSGLDSGVFRSSVGTFDRVNRVWDHSGYGTTIDRVPVYAGCYCNVVSTTEITEKKTYHPGQVVLSHDDCPDLQLLYGHLDRIPDLGDTVQPDTIIGYIKAPEGQLIERYDLHVHVEILKGEQFINPFPYLSPDLQKEYLAHQGNYSQTIYRGGFPQDPYRQPNGYYGQPYRSPIQYNNIPE